MAVYGGGKVKSSSERARSGRLLELFREVVAGGEE